MRQDYLADDVQEGNTAMGAAIAAIALILVEGDNVDVGHVMCGVSLFPEKA